MRLSLSIFFGLALVACQVNPSAKHESAIEPYTMIDGSSPAFTKNSVGGESYMQFDRPLQGINSKEHYIVELESFKEGGSFVLHSHFNGFQYLDGVQLNFVRTVGDLKVSVSTPGYIARSLTTIAGVFDASNPARVRLRIEIHNGGTSDGVQIFIWNDLVNLNGSTWSHLDRITEQNAAFTSRTQYFPSHGRGVFWGLELKGPVLTRASQDLTYVE